MISLIHPSRGRPEKSFQTIKKWIECSSLVREVIVSIDDSDSHAFDYITAYGNLFNHGVAASVLSHDNKSSVEAINNGAKNSTGQILIIVSDDTDCYKGWDQDLYRVIDGKYDFILKTQDGIQPWIITLPIMDRAYYNRFGYIYHPGYQHLFCDTELTCVADILGRKITSNLLFPHNHYSIGKATLDSVYSKNDRTNEQGEKLFLERYARNFDLPPGNKINDRGMIDWLKKRHVA